MRTKIEQGTGKMTEVRTKTEQGTGKKTEMRTKNEQGTGEKTEMRKNGSKCNWTIVLIQQQITDFSMPNQPWLYKDKAHFVRTQYLVKMSTCYS